MDKQFMVDQLVSRIRETAMLAMREHEAAATEAREGASPDEKRIDARVALEYSNLAHAQSRRASAHLDELALVEALHLPKMSAQKPRIAVGTVVEVEDGDEGRTIFLAPAGAGIELTMPDGDGYMTVVTPSSPLGKALLGRTIGDCVEITVKGETREWTVTYVA